MLANLIPTRMHGVIDYLMGVLLIAAPWLLGFADNRYATMVPVILGAGMLLYSVLTDYELGVVHTIPMGTHLMLDLLAGLFLAASPWLFGFADRITWPHVTFGILEMGVALITARVPSLTRRDPHVGQHRMA